MEKEIIVVFLRVFKWVSNIFLMALLFLAASISFAGSLIVEDFENDDYGAWSVAGTAFGTEPATGTLPGQMQVSGYLGDRLVNSFNGGDQSTGSLTSPPFTIEKSYISFLIGGGGYDGETCMNLLVNNEVVRTATGPNTESGGSEALDWSYWDVGELMGQTAELEIIDQRTGGWGHITVDQIIQSDQIVSTVFETDLEVSKKYLVVPIKSSSNSQESGQIFQLIDSNGNVVREFRALLPENGRSPDWYAYYPIDEFLGEKLCLRSKTTLLNIYSDAAGSIFLDDTVPLVEGDYELPYRDQFHFSPRRGWNNDVNGLVYNDGIYHLYYQYNPFNISWDNMHWGHAVSPDLIHWTEQDIALFQNGIGDMMFSGGGFMDTLDSANIAPDGIVPQYAAFTSTGRGECLAYSLDGGFTFTELPENPVVKHRGRDPKIIWYEPEQKWVMVVFDLTDEIVDPPPLESVSENRIYNSVAFYSSKDLKNWTFESRFVHPDRDAIYECPELFEIPVEGNPGETRWILYGVENRYFIGDFDGHQFVAEAGPFNGETGIARAAQTVSDAPDSRRIQIAWATGGQYLNRWPDQCVSQGFLLPKDVTLHETDDGLRLFFYPVVETDAFRKNLIVSAGNPSLSEINQILERCEGKLLDVFLEYELDNAAALEVIVNGQVVSISESGTLRVLSDRTITEAFINRGEQAISYRRPESTFDDIDSSISLAGQGNITQFIVYEMNSIWNSETDLVAHWKFDETALTNRFSCGRLDSGPNALMLSHFSNTCTRGFVGLDGDAMITLRDVSFSNSTYTSGLGNSSSLLKPDGDFSVSVFVDPFVNDVKANVFCVNRSYGMELIGGKKQFNFYVFTDSGVADVRTPEGGLPSEVWDGIGGNGDGLNNDIQWYHLVGTYNSVSGELALYANGVKYTNTLSGAGSPRASSSVFCLGEDSGVLPGMLGLYDDLQFYDRVLSEAEVVFLRDNPGSEIPHEVPFLSLNYLNGVFSVSATNLSLSGINCLQRSSDLESGVWSNISVVLGVLSTNWEVPSVSQKSFFRILREQ